METTIGSRIRERRKALGLSVAELVGRAKLSESLLEKLEQGRRGDGTTATTAFALADALACDVRWLVSGEGAVTPGADPLDPSLDEGRPSLVA